MKSFEKALQRIKEAKNILLVTHNRPDGDALASMCIMIELLVSLNKKYFAYCLDKPPAPYSFLPHVEEISTQRERLDFNTRDVIIPLDCGSMSRTNLVKEINGRRSGQYIIEFDHHPRVDDYADLELRFPDYSSTSEVLYHFLKANKIKINKNYANCILTGILTDTSNLLNDATTDQAVHIASEMLLYGARYPSIIEYTKRNKSLNAMKLWGKAMSNLIINPRYQIAFSVLTHEDMVNAKVTDEELEGISNFLSTLHGIKALMFLRQEEPNLLKGSLRTIHPKVDVSQLAKHLGGGGHKKSAGFVLRGKLKKTATGWKVS